MSLMLSTAPDPRPSAVIESSAAFADLQAAVRATVPPACCTLRQADESPPGCAWYEVRSQSHAAADGIREVRATLLALQAAAVASDYFRIVQGAHFALSAPPSPAPDSSTHPSVSPGAAA